MKATDFADLVSIVGRINNREGIERCFDVVQGRDRYLRAVKANEVANSLRVGQKVTFKGKYGAIESGKVTKINRTTASVKTADITWTVSLNLLKAV
jgi:hypothetical protein